MIIALFNLYILFVCFVILRNIQTGFVLSLVSMILIPSLVRFSLGPISVSIHDVFLCVLFISFIYHKCYRKRIQRPVRKYFSIYVISTFILIFLSSGYVPYDYQLKSFLKGFLFHRILYIWIGFLVLEKANVKKILSAVSLVSLFAGIYGIVSYMYNQNIYITVLNLVYGGEDTFAYFLDEVRGGLNGRTYGTMTHPLAWGQYWNIFLCILWISRKQMNKYLLWSLIAIGSVNIILCGSRTAIVVSLVFLLFVLVSYGIKKLLLILPFAYLSLTLCLLAMPDSVKNSGIISYIESGVFFWDSSYSEKAGISGSSANMRLVQLQRSIEVMSTNPLGGIGYNYEYYALETGRVVNSDLYGLESIVFKVLIEQGLLGLFIFIYTYNYLRRYFLLSGTVKTKILVNGYFAAFFVSILFTGIQGMSYILFMFFLTLLNVKNNDTQNNTLLLAK